MFQAHTAGVHRTEEEVACLSRVFPVSGLGKVRQFRAQLCNLRVCSGLKAQLCHLEQLTNLSEVQLPPLLDTINTQGAPNVTERGTHCQATARLTTSP